MPTPTDKTNALTPHWLFCAAMLMLLLGYNLICYVWADNLRINLPDSQRVVIRTLCYVIAIALFPLTNLMRHILLRLNQTMPGNKTAAQRYLVTVIVTQTMIEIVSLFGLLMFILGDEINTLYIFTLMGAVGIYLHKPKPAEFQSIVYALTLKND